MGHNSHRDWSRPVLGLVAAATAFVSGCVGPSGSPTPTPTAGPATTSATPVPAALKYTFARLPGCVALQEAVRGLPRGERKEDSTGGNSPDRSCTFRGANGDQSWVDLNIRVWESSENATGPQPGSKRAKDDFVRNATPRDEQASGPGAEARWLDPDSSKIGCRLEVLDENAVLTVFYVSGRNDPPRGEQCRGRATELAGQLYAAVQPR
ncbi:MULTISPECIES: hypothetical protein [unclassified Crossiella]|uniref:hypothetical protein n=1 Tax=unclassified Crossiella TaxID=2620835 RepID=UPI001FFF7E58|nr:MULTISPECIES: hypothetical protein [unclassified Crossiella]MCK2242822.1 hypothetical protein [Crossiella sp. S99.2]MCK2256699.1 hypothetical protein [Crossiella sp. S99.1]